MKKLFTLICCLVLWAGLLNAQKSVDKFISKHLKEDKTIAMSFPGWLVGSSMNFIANMDEDHELEDYAKLAKHIKNIRIFAATDNHNIPTDEVKKLMSKMTNSEGYDEYIRVRSGGTTVNLFAIEKKDRIKQLVFLVDEADDNFILVRLKLDLPYDVFADLNYKLQQEIRP